MLDAMQNQVLAIGMEADSPLSRFTALTKRLPALINTARSFISDMVALDSITKSNVVYSGNTIKAINAATRKVRYSDIRDLPISVPSGFKGNILSYGMTLEPVVALISTIGESRLEKMERWLANVITNPKTLSSLNTEFIVGELKPLPLEEHRVALYKFFDFTKLTTDSTFGAVYSRLEDLAKVDRLVKQFSETLSKKNRDATVKRLETVVALLDKLMVLLSRNRDDLEVSSNSIKAIAETTFQLAKECDFYATVYALVVALNESVESTANTLNSKQ